MSYLKKQCLKYEQLALFYYLFEKDPTHMEMYVADDHLKIEFKDREKFLENLSDFTKTKHKWNSVWKRLHRLGFKFEKGVYSKYIPGIQKKKRKITIQDESFKDKIEMLEKFAHDIFENDDYHVLLEVSLQRKRPKVNEKPLNSIKPKIPAFISPGLSEITDKEFIPPWYLAKSIEYNKHFK